MLRTSCNDINVIVVAIVSIFVIVIVFVTVIIFVIAFFLQCFDTVGWVI